MKKIALVTGAYKGLGFKTCQELAKQGITVILSCRKEKEGLEQTRLLQDQGLDVHFQKIDVDNIDSIISAYEAIKANWQRVDILINNAAILFPKIRLNQSANLSSQLQKQQSDFIKSYQTNTVAPYQLCELFIPLMMKNNYGRVVNVSSHMGSLGTMRDDYPAYRLTKTALNAVTLIYANMSAGKNVLINSICPGWVKTDMGGPEAPKSIEQGVDSIVWAATLPDGSPTGGFFQERRPIEW